MSLIAVVDYGTGNLRSVSQAVKAVADPADNVIVTQDAAMLAAADRVVFPGQGAMRDCMRQLEMLGLKDAVSDALSNKPVLPFASACRCCLIEVMRGTVLDSVCIVESA